MLAAGLGTGGSINVTPVYGAGSPSTWVPYRGAYFTPDGNLIITESGTPVVRNPNGAGFAADGSLCTCTSGGTFAPSANLLLDSVGRVQILEGTDSAPDSGGIPLDANGALYVTTKNGGPTGLFVNGEPESAKLILRDLVNATIGFESLAEQIHKPAKSLHRMLSQSGNPTMSNISAVFAAIKRALKVQVHTQIVVA
jgi:DNA-binding phage protein